MPDLTPEDLDETAELDRLVQEALRRIIEHSDSVQIIVTKRLENGKGETYRHVAGLGNSYARFGAAKEWVNEQEGMQSRRFSDDIDETD
jgi:hypothetical protein